jgi:phospholipid/cholesterol/gamma-HCH transport system substrate-binding protein
VTTAIRKHLLDFAAILGLILVAAIVGGYILSNQRFYLPSWVPVAGTDFFTINGEFRSAKAVTPGQGQTVTMAGVNVGDITRVELVDGRARVQMKVKRRYADRIRKDATMLLRPKSGLEDMVIELTPGTKEAEKAPEGWTVPVQNTLPDVKFDEIVASLDRDTRDYLTLLVNGAGEGLKDNGDDLAGTLKRFEPGARNLRRIGDALDDRRGNIRRSIHNLRLLVEAVGEKDDQLAQLLDSSNAVFRSFTAQDRNLRTALQELPPTLRTTRTTLGKVDELGQTAGKAFRDLRPTARALGPTLRKTRPFVRETAPIVRDQIRPFARDVRPTVRSLRPAAAGLSKTIPDLLETFKVVNYLFNTLAYNPPGDAEEGYLFWAAWANHLGSNIFSTQDAHGPIRRGHIVLSCSTASVLDTIIAGDPRLGTIAQLSGVPINQQVCPQSSQAGGAGVNSPGANTPAPGGTR